MAMRDIFGIAVAVLIALLSQIVEPWSKFWWTGMIVAGIIASASAADILLKTWREREGVENRMIPLIVMVVCGLGFICFFTWYLWPTTRQTNSDLDGAITPRQNAPVRSDPRPQASNDSPPPVILDVTPDYLMELYRDHSSVQADKLAAFYIGKLIPVSGRLEDVHGPTFGNKDKMEVSLHNNRKQIVLISLYFKIKWRERLEVMQKNQKLSAICEVLRIGSYYLDLDNCDFRD